MANFFSPATTATSKKPLSLHAFSQHCVGEELEIVLTELTQEQRDRIDAAAFRRMLSHLDNNKDVQNIALMITADFCRNCLGDWWREEAEKHGVAVSKDEARERIYGMPYSEWKDRFQGDATPEQMAAFKARRDSKSS